MREQVKAQSKELDSKVAQVKIQSLANLPDEVTSRDSLVRFVQSQVQDASKSNQKLIAEDANARLALLHE